MMNGVTAATAVTNNGPLVLLSARSCVEGRCAFVFVVVVACVIAVGEGGRHFFVLRFGTRLALSSALSSFGYRLVTNSVEI